MENPLVSVIVPVFNEEKYIKRCVASLVGQTCRELQIILVDGGSTDASPQICDGICSEYDNISVIHTDNRGVSFSRNLGIEASKGKYIIFIDCDDWLETDAIEQMCLVMEKEDTDIVGCKFAVRSEESSQTDSAMTDSEKPGWSAAGEKAHNNGNESGAEINDGLRKIKYRYNKLTAKNFLSDNIYHGDVHCWGRLYRAELIKDRLSFRQDLTIGEDMLFLIEYLKKSNEVITLDYDGYNYYLNPTGAMSKPFTLRAMDQISCWHEVEKLLGANDMSRMNIMISVMLVAGRIAILPTAERKKYSDQIDILLKELVENRTSGAVRLLDRGYRIKTRLFGSCPELYLRLYHRHKSH